MLKGNKKLKILSYKKQEKELSNVYSLRSIFDKEFEGINIKTFRKEPVKIIEITEEIHRLQSLYLSNLINIDIGVNQKVLTEKGFQTIKELSQQSAFQRTMFTSHHSIPYIMVIKKKEAWQLAYGFKLNKPDVAIKCGSFWFGDSYE